MPDSLEQIEAVTIKLAQIEAVTIKLAESRAKLAEARAKLAEADAKLDGTYLEDCDGLWLFTREHLPKENDERLGLFDKISRTTLRQCYDDIDTQFLKFTAGSLPNPTTESLGTASFKINGQVDIFNNGWNNQRAHLIPNSTICAPHWGHSAEGALQPLPSDGAMNKNKARKLLVMGYDESRKLRTMPQNFINFADNTEVYDVDPSVVIIPIMTLCKLCNSWEADTSFDALVIASKITKPDCTEPCLAEYTYRKILSHFEYKDENFCTPEDIDAATLLIRHFLLGHAGSLAAGIPTDIDPDNSSPEGKEVLEELEKVKQEIISNGIALPGIRKEKTFRKVLKVRFSGENGAPIPDPWLLAAKAAVNLSSIRGQKLLPACKKAEEDDYEILQELHDYQMRRRLDNIPAELNIICAMGEVPDTVVTTPKQEGGDDWETLGD